MGRFYRAGGLRADTGGYGPPSYNGEVPDALDVLLPLPLPPFRFLPPFSQPEGPIGARVAVPWQGGIRIGLVVGRAAVDAAQALDLKEAVSWLDCEPFVSAAAPQLVGELAYVTGAPAGVVLATLLPVGVRDELRHEVRAVEGVTGVGLPADAWVDGSELEPEQLDLWRHQGLILERVRVVPELVRMLVPLRPPDAELSRRPQANQRLALERLHELEAVASAAELADEVGVPVSAVRALVRKGYAGYAELPAPPPPLPGPPLLESSAPSLAPGGAAAGAAPWPERWPVAAEAALTGGTRRHRLEVVAALLRGDLAAGGSVLVLVPEVALLDDAAARLAALGPVLMLRGEYPDAVRARVWEECARPEPKILIGTYQALLAPLPALARVVVLEANSASYKLPSGARLFVPSAARRLARLAEVPLLRTDPLLGAELLAEVAAEARLTLPQPARRLYLVDLSESRNWPLSSELLLVLRQVAERGRQAVLLAPRRGFSAALGCRDCGRLVMCPNCDLPLRFHQDERRLRCHQCGHAAVPPTACGHCRGELAPQRAAGTQWIAKAVAAAVPELPWYRYDADRRDDLGPLVDGEPGVLVATTAALRLPPLPKVALVGVTLLDSFLNQNDFRAEENALRLLLELGELAPGGRPLTVVQTFQPRHPVLELFRAENLPAALEAFAAEMLARRRRFGYPPAYVFARFQVTSRDRAGAQQAAERLAGSLRQLGVAAADILGPAPAPVARVRGQFAYQLLLRAADEEAMGALLAKVATRGIGARVRVDVDPRDVGRFLE